MNRRAFMGAGVGAAFSVAQAQGPVERTAGSRIKLALNAYSFNRPLRSGEVTLYDLIDFCAEHSLDALDCTGYYFPGYPDVPGDEYLYRLKRKGFVNGVDINGTGVRNDFALTDPESRKRDVQLVKNWIVAARKLGATVVRVFAGKKVPDGHTFEQAAEWMIEDLKECAAFGREHGVIVGLQNHNEFIKTADEAIHIVEGVDSDWLGVILDVGSLRRTDPYREIEKLLPYAVSWQLKEKVWYDDKEVDVDVARIKEIIERVGYRGYVPIETLGPGDPFEKVAKFAAHAHRVLGV